MATIRPSDPITPEHFLKINEIDEMKEVLEELGMMNVFRKIRAAKDETKNSQARAAVMRRCLRDAPHPDAPEFAKQYAEWWKYKKKAMSGKAGQRLLNEIEELRSKIVMQELMQTNEKPQPYVQEVQGGPALPWTRLNTKDNLT